jgi:GH25 family lysozyme M1 (1,4-beta-N-acetylmuramidase)
VITLTGRMSTFGGPGDTGVSPSEGLALYSKAEQRSELFLATQPPGTTGLARRLNPDTRYVACRWNYSETPPSFLRGRQVQVVNDRTNLKALAWPADWGPNISTGRVADLSPGLARALGLRTDDRCHVIVPEPLDVLATQAPIVKIPTVAAASTFNTVAASPAPVINFTPKLVDLSHYDDLVNIQQVKEYGILGIVNKVSEGPGMVDVSYARRKPVVLGAGLQYGGYHFLRPGDMAYQAGHYLNAIGDVTNMMLMGDWEVASVTPQAAREWFGAVHDKTSRWPRLYSYSAMLMQLFGTRASDPVLAQCPLWLAAYNNHPLWPTQIWRWPDIWQFTGDGNGNGPHQVPGILLPGSRGIDIDAYEGGDAHATTHSDAELLASWAS